MKGEPQDQSNKLCTSIETQCPGAPFFQDWDDGWDDEIFNDFILMTVDYDED